MIKVDIISGFLGAGKTTLIQKLLKEAIHKEEVVLIENEFGEIGIDGGFLKEAGVEIKEMNSGCICCSLVGDFRTSLIKVIEDYHPQRIIIEPSGVGKLSDVRKAVEEIDDAYGLVINSLTTVADAQKCRMYMKNFHEFYANQIAYANTVILSRTQHMSDVSIAEALHILREENPDTNIITTPWDNLEGTKILATMEAQHSLTQDWLNEEDVCPTCGEHHEHHHDHEHGECCGEHHHHDHEHDECCEEHHHHHDHDENCDCGCHEHHHHHADEVFTSWGRETAVVYDEAELYDILHKLADSDTYGQILRAKGMVAGRDGWLYFDVVPQEINIRKGNADIIGRICVIGAKLDEAGIATLFAVK